MSIEDLIKGEIHYPWLFMLLDFRFFLGYFCLLFVILLYPLIKDKIGGADLLIFSLLATRYCFQRINQIILIASLVALFWGWIFKQQRLKFIPFIFFGFIVTI